MQTYSIIFSHRFECELQEILDFIALNSPNRAEQFKRDIYAKINTLTFNPLRCRAHSGEDKNLRDLIFKGYIVVFLVENTHIEILGIYKNNQWGA